MGTLRLTRQQLAAFLGNDQDAIKKFERLIATVEPIAPDVVADVQTQMGQTEAKAQEALDDAATAVATANHAETTAQAAISALAGKQPLDQDLTDIAALVGDGFPKRTGLVWAMNPGGGGGGSTITSGTAVIDFGAFPGSNEASIAVTGQTSILAGSEVDARIAATATGDHTANDHAYAAAMVGVSVGSIVAGTGFTIFGRSVEKMQGTFNIQWAWA